jgi:hypothetical protein
MKQAGVAIISIDRARHHKNRHTGMALKYNKLLKPLFDKGMKG